MEMQTKKRKRVPDLIELPEELLEMIFQWLDPCDAICCETVCKGWRRILLG